MALSPEDRTEIATIAGQAATAAVQTILQSSPQFASMMAQKPFQIPSESESRELLAFAREVLFPMPYYDLHEVTGERVKAKNLASKQLHIATVDTVRSRMAQHRFENPVSKPSIVTSQNQPRQDQPRSDQRRP